MQSKKIFLIDPLAKLALEKDGSLLWALTAKAAQIDCYLLFAEDLFLTNSGLPKLKLWQFSGSINSEQFSVEEFKLTKSSYEQIQTGDELLMRLDPPFDSRYLKILWLLDILDNRGLKVKNSPAGILAYNEKNLASFTR